MPSLQLFSTNGFKIENRISHDFKYIIQVIAQLLTTSSPLEDTTTSLYSLIGKNEVSELSPEISIRIKDIEDIMKSEYGLKRISLVSIDKQTDSTYIVKISVQNKNGQSYIGSILV